LVEEGGDEAQEQPQSSGGLGMFARIFALPKKRERDVEE